MGIRGIESIEIDGTIYRLKYSYNAIAELEENYEIYLVDLEAQLGERFSLDVLRKVLWAGFRETDPDISLKDVSELIELAAEEGKFQMLVEKLGAAVQSCVEKFGQGAEGNSDAKPKKK